MKYQLIIQFPETVLSYDDLIELEDLIIAALNENLADVDGHDMGAGEANIFILTNEPVKVFEEVKKLLSMQLVREVKAAYREIAGEEYFIIWPDSLKYFRVV
ncbi:MAG TPA: hypothetical protein VI298_05995 [Geobacteraceae bacterium]